MQKPTEKTTIAADKVLPGRRLLYFRQAHAHSRVTPFQWRRQILASRETEQYLHSRQVDSYMPQVVG